MTINHVLNPLFARLSSLGPNKSHCNVIIKVLKPFRGYIHICQDQMCATNANDFYRTAKLHLFAKFAEKKYVWASLELVCAPPAVHLYVGLNAKLPSKFHPVSIFLLLFVIILVK